MQPVPSHQRKAHPPGHLDMHRPPPTSSDPFRSAIPAPRIETVPAPPAIRIAQSPVHTVLVRAAVVGPRTRTPRPARAASPVLLAPPLGLVPLRLRLRLSSRARPRRSLSRISSAHQRKTQSQTYPACALAHAASLTMLPERAPSSEAPPARLARTQPRVIRGAQMRITAGCRTERLVACGACVVRCGGGHAWKRGWLEKEVGAGEGEGEGRDANLLES